MKKMISTEKAPQAIGPYSQAIQVGSWVLISGQIPIVPETGEMVSSMIAEQTHQVFKNLQAICEAAGGTLDDLVKVTIYLIDLSHFDMVNQIMKSYFKAPYPARVTIGVASLPKQASVEIEAIMVLP